MRQLLPLILLLALVVSCVGCGEAPAGDADAATLSDAGPAPDGGSIDAMVPPSDGASVDAGFVAPDTGPPEPCEMRGAIESVPCGACGTIERFCTAAGTWAYGVCEGEGVCMPGTTDVVSCGDCGSQAARCTASCTWETTGTCMSEGECTPGERMRSAEGCPAGQTREVLCGEMCAYAPAGMCEMDGCPTPGALETVPCGTMCGTRERFCTAARVWEYGACGGEGVCVPGTTGTQACGMCGMETTRCTASCTWSSTGMCMAEGACSPGAMRRTAMGCPAGQTQAQTCSPACGWTTTEACRADTAVDVMILLDVTGSHGMRVRDQVASIRSRLVTPLLAITNVAVGVSYYADYPIDPYGVSGDRPFEGGIEPSLSFASVSAELDTIPTMNGNDGPESGIEALATLTGTAPRTASLPLVCSAGRTAGGCWRPGARRIVVIWTDAANHNGPDPASTGLFSPYTGISPAPAAWTMASTLGAMRAQSVELLVVYYQETLFGTTEARDQAREMVADLSQPMANVIDGTSATGAAFDTVVARVRTIAGR